jgi:hypothetical protein
MGKTVFVEWLGREIPYRLASALKRLNVSPADVYQLEQSGFSDQRIYEHILEHSTNGYYQPPLW